MKRLLDAYEGETVLAVGAHPDDVEISVGGSLARLSRGGARVVIAIASVPSNLDERIGEAKEAAHILGAELEVLERERCRRVEDYSMSDLVGRLDRLIKEYRPAAIMTHSDKEFHNDHLVVHRVALASSRLAPMDLYFFSPSTCKPMVNNFRPHIWVDISPTIDDKIAAISAHGSQFDRRGICVSTFRDQARAMGANARIAYAEGLEVFCMRA